MSRFREARFVEAAEFAAELVRLRPDDMRGWEILAASRLLQGDRLGALDAWNRMSRPRIAGISFPENPSVPRWQVERAAGMRPGETLSSRRLSTARRRLGHLPAVRASRTDYRVLGGDSVDVDIHLLERGSTPVGWDGLLGIGARAFTGRTLRLDLAAPTGRGEHWAIEGGRRGGWRSEEVRVEGAFASVPGVVEMSLGRERALFAARQDGVDIRIEERRRTVSLGLAHWLTPAVLGELEGGWERLAIESTACAPPRGSGACRRDDHLRVGLALEGRPGPGRSGDRVAIRLAARSWAAFGGSPWFGTGSIDLALRSLPGRDTEMHTRAGVAGTTGNAPRGVWPRAGAGWPAQIRLRARPSMDRRGAVADPLRSPRVVHGGVEVVRWVRQAGSFEFGIAGFLDGAASWESRASTPSDPADASGRVFLDGGAGVRVRLPPLPGELRADWGAGLTEGGTMFSVDWTPEWPAWPRR